jgi:hypothetical protein
MDEKQPVLITGFESSGTTMLRRIVSMNPIFEKDLIHEGRKLLGYHTAQEAMVNYHDDYSHIRSGEKIPYVATELIIKYIDKWKQFWPDSLILHIIRGTDAVADSCYRRFNRPKKVIRNMHIDSVNEVGEHIAKTNNYQNISYELLIDNPFGSIKYIYELLGSVPENAVIEKIVTTKEVWDLDGKRMCGLRYADSIGKK